MSYVIMKRLSLVLCMCALFFTTIGCGKKNSAQKSKSSSTKTANSEMLEGEDSGLPRLPLSQITQSTFESKILQNNNKLIIVDFWTDWCGPCKTLEPVLEELAYEYKDQVSIYRINAEKDNNVYITIDYEVKAYPTILYFRKGQVIDRLSGLFLKEAIAQRIDKHLKSNTKAEQ